MNKTKMKKAQSVVEMMMTYSWAILIISVFVVVVFVLSGSPSGLAYTPSTCTIQPLLPCQDTIITNYSTATENIVYYVSFINELQNPIQFPTNSFNLSTTNIGVFGSASWKGNCYPQFALVGDPVTCITYIPGRVIASVGSKVNTLFTITYELCSNNKQNSCPSAKYKTSGYATQSVYTPSNMIIYSVTFTANGVDGVSKSTIDTNAIMYMNGVPYANNQIAILISPGNYQIYGSTPSGYNFVAWHITSPASTLNSISPLNPILTLANSRSPQSNATITEKYVDVQCGVCTTGVVAAALCPASCPDAHAYGDVACSTAGGGYSECLEN